MGGAETLSASLGQCPEGPKQGVASYHVLWSAPPPPLRILTRGQDRTRQLSPCCPIHPQQCPAEMTLV